MEKRISYSQFQSVKCVAKACDPLITKRSKLKEKLEKLTQEFNDCNTQIASLEAGIISVIGVPVEALVKKVIEPGIDVNGQPKKTTKYLPTDIVSYDADHKQYVITLPDEPKVDDKEDSAATPSETVPDEPDSKWVGAPSATTSPVVASESHEDALPTDAPIFD